MMEDAIFDMTGFVSSQWKKKKVKWPMKCKERNNTGYF